MYGHTLIRIDKDSIDKGFYINNKTMELKNTNKIVDFFARVSLIAIFVNALRFKLTNFTNVVDYIASKGFSEPISILLHIISVILLIVGPVLIISRTYERIGAAIILLFIIPATIIFHVYPFDMKSVVTNLGLIGGLLLLITRSDK